MRTSLRRVLSLTLLTTIALPVGATAASATATTRVAIADPTDDAASHSGAPSPAFPAAEITEAVVEHTTDEVILRLRFAGPSDPLADTDVDPDRSGVYWALRTGSPSDSFTVRDHVENGQHVAKVLDASGTPICDAAVSYDSLLFSRDLTVDRSCIGRPSTVRFSVSSEYYLKPDPMILYARFHDSVPAYGVFSSTAERARIATKLSSAVSASTVTFGNAVTVSGTLTRSANGTAIAGEKVALYRRYPGGSYSKVATVTTNSKGRASFALTPSKNATYQLRHAYAGASGPGLDAVTSTARTIKVRPTVSLKASTTTAKKGATVKLTTKVAPKHAGLKVQLQKRRSDGTWKTVQTGKLDGGSKRTFKITASKSTAGTYRIVAPKHGDHAAGTSAKVKIRLR